MILIDIGTKKIVCEGGDRMAATKKKSNGSKKQTKKSSAATQNTFIKDEIVLLIVLAVAILLMLGNFKIGGAFGNVLNSFMFGMFGLMSYVMPVFLFFCTAFFISNKENQIATIKLFAWILLFLVLCTFFELTFVSNLKSMKILECFTYSKTEKTGGGILGGIFAKMFSSIFGIVGAYVVDVILAIISIVLITEKSFFQGVEKGSRKVYETAKSEAGKHRERTRERQRLQTEESKRRMDKKVSGVSMDLNLMESKKKASQEEMHEITIQGAPIAEQKLDGSYVDIFAEPEIPEQPLPIKETKKEKRKRTEKKEEIKEQIQEQIQITEENQTSSQSVEQANLPKQVDLPQDDVVTSPYKSTIDVGEEEHSMPEEKEATYKFPPLDLLKRGNSKVMGDSKEHLSETAMKLQQTLQNFGVNVKITNVSCGPAVTRYEIQPEQGVKVSKIVNLTDDIKLNLAAADIRMEAPIPGKAAIGIEVPNKESSAVMLRDLLEDTNFIEHPSKLAFAVGKDIGGQSVVTDIAKMPHLLIAGATGSGKSVCINTIIMSILYKARPDEVKLIMVDPKVVELSVYNGIPHLLIPVVTDPKKAAGALNWAVMEMMERYDKFAGLGVRDLKGYNEKIASVEHLEGEKPEKMPQIVIIVDELADLMMVAAGEVEDAICRLAQLARAAGIHLIIATQRPSVNVITGLIKANMPSRIAFAVSSGVDSRTILDMNGAEKLLGKGDMLFFPQGYQKPVRMQCAFVSDKEVSNVVEFLSSNYESSTYSQDIEAKIQSAQSASVSPGGGSETERDTYFEDAAKFIIEKDKASIGMLQRVFKIGFNRAARIMDQLAEAGVVGEEEGTKPRKVLMSMEEFEQYIEEYL